MSKTRIIHGSKHHPLERDDVVVVFRPPANANAGRVRERSVREETRAAAAAAARETPRGRGMHQYRCRFPFDTQNALRSFVRVCNRLFLLTNALARFSHSPPTALEPPQIHRWTQDARLYFLKFPTPVSQKMALGRASVFLEDVDLHGQIVHSIPSGQSGGAANYSGHNMRVNSFCLFLNRCKEENKELFEEEKGLRDRLMECKIVQTNKRGEYESSLAKDNDRWHRSEEQSAILAVCSSSDKEEVKDALIHEAMHGVFYVSRTFQKFCYWFWEERMTEEERKTWVDFLVGLRYNAEMDEELAVNEFQAYMATERKLFEASETARLKQLQLKFSRAMTDPSSRNNGGLEDALTPSIGSGTKVVWL